MMFLPPPTPVPAPGSPTGSDGPHRVVWTVLAVLVLASAFGWLFLGGLR